MTSPTQRTLAHLKARGLTVQVVEHRVPYSNTTRDLFGVIDVVAMDDQTLLGVQTTSDSNLSARRAKCEESTLLRMWLAAPGRTFELHGWGLKGAAGKRKTYQLRRYSAALTPHGIVWTDPDGELWRALL